MTLRRAAHGLMAALLAFATLPFATPAAADELPLWEVGGGAGVLSLPHYRGSDKSRTWLLPIPYIVYRGQIFKADREGARAVLYNTEAWRTCGPRSSSAPTCT